MAGKPSVREMLQDARHKKTHSWCLHISLNVFQTDTCDSLTHTMPHHRPQNTFSLTMFRSFPLFSFTSLIYCTYIHFTFTANMQNLGHNLPPFPQNSFVMGEAQIKLSWGCSPPLTSLPKCHCAVWQSSLYSSIHVGFGQARTKHETVNVQSM